jgi:hypothetical protein
MNFNLMTEFDTAVNMQRKMTDDAVLTAMRESD